jgi:hypothetical protein
MPATYGRVRQLLPLNCPGTKRICPSGDALGEHRLRSADTGSGEFGDRNHEIGDERAVRTILSCMSAICADGFAGPDRGAASRFALNCRIHAVRRRQLRFLAHFRAA